MTRREKRQHSRRTGPGRALPEPDEEASSNGTGPGLSRLRRRALPTALACCAMTLLLLASACPGPAEAGVLAGHPFSKRSFIDIQCKGVYDKSYFAKLDRICEDCYNLFREPQLHTLCRKNCFTTDYFKGCLDVLLLQEDSNEIEYIKGAIKVLHGAEPGF